ncbi:DUF2218 domain-containing protein [Paracoccus sp. MC1862]|uniref:DUF2218 domain-containing protein n=1 Tax=Paracoccus sp. MC1862 TaxID=2760307 RepID=UPI001600DDE4|nr:DUF2218 domain-containing protein [Paracoccus sp. MC1862]MBB1499586.1 DUF2218 domain-containing protein [Paracoccus sp. MC1862]QQO44204.1 DUF2218 domain-containing protein [Paracoccus sp. MC1862]
MISTARYPTPNATKYVQQLAKHFGHKIEVRSDADSADFEMEAGSVRLSAQDGAFVAQVEAEDAKGIINLRYVVDKHLVIFAFRDGFTGLDWRMADG